MIKMRGIAVTDQINRYNEKLDFEGMIRAYENAWDKGFPVGINHDHTKCIGWSQLNGIYMEPGISYQTNSMWIPENKEEHEQLEKRSQTYQYRVNYVEKKEEYEQLQHMLEGKLSQSFKWLWADAVTILDEEIVLRVFPEMKELLHDGLISLQELDPVLPGVYRKGEFLIFAHSFLRRNCSRTNTLNIPLLSRLESLKEKELKVQVAIDINMIGLMGTQVEKREYQYWWGPTFDEDLTKIPLGVARFENENYNELLSNIRQTEFWWYIQDERQTLECEEITDIPNMKYNEEDYYGCRYVHSMLDKETGLPTHSDGAIRAYDDERMLARLETSLNNTERNTKYTKLWRVDENISVSLWKELISHYFRDNRLVGEYFGGVDKNDQKELVEEAKEEKQFVPLHKFIPVDFPKNNGIRATIQFHPKMNLIEGRDVVINMKDFFFLPNRKGKYYEAETLTVIKLLKRQQLNVRIPFANRMGYEDLIFNFPIFECRTIEIAELVQKCIMELCEAWNKESQRVDRLLAYSIQINYENKSVLFSFAGNTVDIEKTFHILGTKLPTDEGLARWSKSLRDNLNTYENVKGKPTITDLMRSDGTLHFAREMVPPELIEETGLNKKEEYATLKVKKEDYFLIKENNIQIAPMYIIKSSRCNKCKKAN